MDTHAVRVSETPHALFSDDHMGKKRKKKTALHLTHMSRKKGPLVFKISQRYQGVRWEICLTFHSRGLWDLESREVPGRIFLRTAEVSKAFPNQYSQQMQARVCRRKEAGKRRRKKTESIVGNPERREGWEVGVRIPESLLRILGLRVSFGKRPGGKRLA